MSNGEVFGGVIVLALFFLAIACAIERGAKLPDEPESTRDETVGRDQHAEQRRAALPFQYPASKGFDAQRPYHEKDRDGSRRREELSAAVKTGRIR
jgi:hypothetical protein